MIIKVDNREEELIKKIKQLVLFIPIFKDIKVITVNLPIGDVIISDEKEDKIIIERKSLNDLLSSIKDGRYEEQSYRLNGVNHHNHNIYYLIEGDINKYNGFKENKTDKMTLYSSIFSLNYYKGFSVMRTLSIDETALFICNTTTKLKKSEVAGRKPFYQTNQNNQTNQTNQNNQNTENNQIELCDSEYNNIVSELEQTSKDYVSVVKKVKKDNITPNNIGEIMLCQIPGISSVTSIAIMEKFKTIPNLIEEVNKNEECLHNISYINTKGQTRKINKTSVINIIKFLLKR